MAQISIVLATRTGATEYKGPVSLLDDMRKTIYDPKNIEVIIRGDLDDEGFDSLTKKIEEKKYPFPVKTIKGNRGRGYEDLHNFYNDCLLYTSPAKKIIFSLPEDVSIISRYWDIMLLNQYKMVSKKLGHTIFTMHQTLLPGLCDTFDSTLETPDAFPMYTAEWLNAVGGFSHTGANDSWVQATHHFLLRNYGFDVRHFLPVGPFSRYCDMRDSIVHERWANARLRNHDLLRSKRVKKMLMQQAEVLYACACKQLQNASSQANAIPVMFDTLNLLCDFSGSPSVLFRMMYHLANNGKPEQMYFIPDEIEEVATRLLNLKRTVPDVFEETKDCYTMIPSSVNNLNAPFLSGISCLSKKPKWIQSLDVNKDGSSQTNVISDSVLQIVEKKSLFSVVFGYVFFRTKYCVRSLLVRCLRKIYHKLKSKRGLINCYRRQFNGELQQYFSTVNFSDFLKMLYVKKIKKENGASVSSSEN